MRQTRWTARMHAAWRGTIARAAMLSVGALGLTGCGTRTAPQPAPAPLQVFTEVRSILDVMRPSTEYYDMRERLAGMGPEVDAALVAMAYDPEEKTIIRANAITLLAERRSPAALEVMRRILFTEDREILRSAAVLGLQRLSTDTPAAANLVRGAVGDPARTVRLNALQSLDIRDVTTIRRLLEKETDREVRKIASQLVALAESRGAPLAADRHGALRTVEMEREPALVFRPFRTDTVMGYMTGDLRVEFPNRPSLPLAQGAEVVGGVIPAFFSPDREKVVYEVDREIRVMDLRRRTYESLGPGIAPRLIPLSNQFVFLRERPGARVEVEGGIQVTYQVLRSDFSGAKPFPIGETTAVLAPTRHGNYSPARWMVVGETPTGFVLRGEHVSTFVLPSPGVGAAPPAGDSRSGR